MKIVTIVLAGLLIANTILALTMSAVSLYMLQTTHPEVLSYGIFAAQWAWGVFGHLLSLLVAVLAIIVATRTTDNPPSNKIRT